MFHLIPPLIADHIFGKKLSLIGFLTQILPKILPATHTFSFTMMKYLKKFIGIKSVNRKQCPAGLFPTIIPSAHVSPPFTKRQQN